MSSAKTRSYLWVEDLSMERTRQLFSKAKQIKKHLREGLHPRNLEGKQVALVFSEASTRTKMSFQLAAQRLGAQCLVIDNVKSSSMSKGESFFDTFWTLHSIKPDLFVIRCGGDDPLEQVTEKSSIPVINAGFGAKAHPTQALLDAFTVQEAFGRIEGLNILYVGDIDYSRVASSGIKLFESFGANVKICAPQALRKNCQGRVENIAQLEEAIEWCDVYIGLRVQFERHQNSDEISSQEYIRDYSLNEKRLSLMKPEVRIMHPGPVNWGTEFQDCVGEDSRLLMWQQKENGVYVRATLMEELLKGSL